MPNDKECKKCLNNDGAIGYLGYKATNHTWKNCYE